MAKTPKPSRTPDPRDGTLRSDDAGDRRRGGVPETEAKPDEADSPDRKG